MRKLCITILGTFIVVLASCASNNVIMKPQVFFERQSLQDTTYFDHILIQDQPFSIELLGQVDSVTESSITFHIQIGVYEHQEDSFAKDLLKLNHNSVIVSANGLPPLDYHSYQLLTNGRPHTAMTYHTYKYDLNSLRGVSLTEGIARIDLVLENYIIYNDKAIKLDPAVVLVPLPDNAK